MITLPLTPITGAGLRRLGLSDQQVRRLVAEGQLRRVLNGVYCRADVGDSVSLRAKSASLIVPDHMVVCDQSAAWLWGIDSHQPDERFTVPDLEIVAIRGHQPLHRARIRSGERDLSADEITNVGGLRVTTPVRTALDIACLRGRYRAIAALDAFMRQHSVTLADYRRSLVRFKGRRGVTQARELVELATPKAESPAESWTRLMIIDAGLPAPEPQFSITLEGVEVFRPDLAYGQWRIAIEYFGEEFHGPEQEDHDEARQEWLEKRHWHVIVVRKEDLGVAAREVWLQELADKIVERSAPGKRVYARAERLIRRRRQ